MKLKYKILSIIPDSIYLKIKYFYFFKKKLDLTSPRNYNEKIQWLKLYDRKEQYTKMVDKYEAKDYVSNLIGNKYIIPTIEIYNKFEDIDFNKLPNQFVIKCTHDSGSVIIVDNKNSFNIIDAKKYINMRMKLNYYYMHREWPYKNIKPRIIIEKYMGNNIKDYKFFCFNGKPEIMYISEGSHTRKQYIAFYDI